MIRRLRDTSQSLTFRIAALLALALLPIGLISVATTYQLLNEAQKRSENNLLALTAEAAAPEEAYVRTGMGAATLLVSMIPELRRNGWNCAGPLQRFLRNSQAFSFAGYVDADGTIVCASDGEGTDVSQRVPFIEMANEPRTRVSVSPYAVVSQTSVVLISVPVMTDGRFDGYVTVSLPHGRLFRPLEEISAERPLDLITYNADAEILTASGGLEMAEMQLPANRALKNLVLNREAAFVDTTRDGDRRVFAVVPIVPGQVFAMGSWPDRRTGFIAGFGITTSMVFPVAMWVVCLGVAFFAVQRMVIRPTRNLRARMLQFMRSRRLTEPRHDAATPRELREMEETWMRLAENVLHDEAELYDTIHQRTVLLKEVHHRVKNNLQLIVSILNMKVRKARSGEVRLALSDIRERVMGIARVHQNLYETSTTERVHAGELLRTIAGQIVRSGIDDIGSIRFDERYEDVVVYPDQAVPLSLAVTELLTNALKNLGKPADGGKPVLAITLVHDGQGGATLEVRNSRRPDGTPDPDSETTSTGLGVALVNAFTHQIEGTCSTDVTEEHFSVTLRFPIAEFDDTSTPAEIALAE